MKNCFPKTFCMLILMSTQSYAKDLNTIKKEDITQETPALSKVDLKNPKDSEKRLVAMKAATEKKDVKANELGQEQKKQGINKNISGKNIALSTTPKLDKVSQTAKPTKILGVSGAKTKGNSNQNNKMTKKLESVKSNKLDQDSSTPKVIKKLLEVTNPKRSDVTSKVNKMVKKSEPRKSKMSETASTAPKLIKKSESVKIEVENESAQTLKVLEKSVAIESVPSRKSAINLKLSPVRLDRIDFDGGFEVELHNHFSIGLSVAGKGLDTFSDSQNFNLSIKEQQNEDNELMKTRYISASLANTYYVDGMTKSNFYFRFLFSFGILEGKLNKKNINVDHSNLLITQSNTVSHIRGFSPTVGYQWLWENGFNLNLGFGPSIFKSDALEINYTDSQNGDRYSVDRRYGNDIFPYANVTFGLML